MATLDDIPDAGLERLAESGFNWVWLLSVWQTGLASRSISRSKAGWCKEFQATLPDLQEQDMVGSGFAICAYSVHSEIWEDAALSLPSTGPRQWSNIA